MSNVNLNLVEISFNKSASFSANSLGYGTIKSNGIGIFYQVYLTDKTDSGIVITLPSRKKPDGSYENQAYFLSKEAREVYEPLVLKEIKAKGITIQPAKQLQTKVIIEPVKSSSESYGINSLHDDELPF